jgi:hypothetical protein
MSKSMESKSNSKDLASFKNSGKVRDIAPPNNNFLERPTELIAFIHFKKQSY